MYSAHCMPGTVAVAVKSNMKTLQYLSLRRLWVHWKTQRRPSNKLEGDVAECI